MKVAWSDGGSNREFGALRYKPEGRGFDSRCCDWNLSLIYSFQPHYGPGVDSDTIRNEYQEYFVWVKAAGAYGWQPYHVHVPTVLKSGSLNFLEPTGSFQASNGTALYLPFIPLPNRRPQTHILFLSSSDQMWKLTDRAVSGYWLFIERLFPYLTVAHLPVALLNTN